MIRQTVNGGTWFDLGAAKEYLESSHHDGCNRISDATGSQWDHEALYLTKGGAYVLQSWSQRDGVGESWDLLSPESAAEWLVRAGYDLPDSLSDVESGMEV